MNRSIVVLLLLVLFTISHASFRLPISFPKNQDSNFYDKKEHAQKQSSDLAHKKKSNLDKAKASKSNMSISKNSKNKLKKGNQAAKQAIFNKKINQRGIKKIQQDDIDAKAHKIGFEKDKGSQMTKFNNKKHDDVDKSLDTKQNAKMHKKSIRKADASAKSGKSFADHAEGDDQQDYSGKGDKKWGKLGNQSSRLHNQAHKMGNQDAKQKQSKFDMDQMDQEAAKDHKSKNRRTKGESTNALSKKQNDMVNYINDLQNLKRNKNNVFEDNQYNLSEGSQEASEAKDYIDKENSNNFNLNKADQDQKQLSKHKSSQGAQSNFANNGNRSKKISNQVSH